MYYFTHHHKLLLLFMFVHRALKFPISFQIEKKLKTISYPYVFVAQTVNSLLCIIVEW